MGVNDDREMLEAAKEECGRLERYNDELKELLQDAYAKYVKDTDILFLARKDAERERDAALALIAEVQADVKAREHPDDWNVPCVYTKQLHALLAKSPSDALAEHDREVKAKALDEFAAILRERYPEDVFRPLSDTDHKSANDALAGRSERTHVTRDRVSADMMRRAASQSSELAAEIRKAT